MEISQNWGGYLFGNSYNKYYTILGSILGSPYFGTLPYSLTPYYEPVSPGTEHSPFRDYMGILFRNNLMVLDPNQP